MGLENTTQENMPSFILLIHKLDMKKIPISLYSDLSKAFDSLLHKILLGKFQPYTMCEAMSNVTVYFIVCYVIHCI